MSSMAFHLPYTDSSSANQRTMTFASPVRKPIFHLSYAFVSGMLTSQYSLNVRDPPRSLYIVANL